MSATAQDLRRGFTLIELLVVLAIMTVLASLLAVALVSAKRKARQTQCLSNLHQHGLALATFVSDHNEYPLATSFDVTTQYPDHHRNWEGALFPEMLGKHGGLGDSGVFHCPAAQPSQDAPPGYSSYGYNAWGLGGLISKPLLGIGGRGPGPQISSGKIVASYAPPVRVSEIANPSEMLAIGDGFDGWNGVIRDGMWVLGGGPDAQEYFDSTRRSRQRHRGMANALFCDGHTASLSLSFLFEDKSDGALRIWNRDNQPHRERVF